MDIVWKWNYVIAIIDTGVDFSNLDIQHSLAQEMKLIIQ